MRSFVVQLDLSLRNKLERGLQEQQFTFAKPAHTFFQAKKPGLCVTLYTSGKLMVQGKGSEEFIKYFLEPEILGTFTYGYESQEMHARIGVDESGKGDFFGPLCVAAVFADQERIEKLTQEGVKDSKRLKDSTIAKLATKIRKICPYHVVKIGPLKYNELYEKFGNLNLLLGWGHATVIDHLMEKTGCEQVILDKFAAEHVVLNALKQKKRKCELVQVTKGESDVVVAAASIVARASFVDAMHKLEEHYKLKLPKGASAATVEAGRKFVRNFGFEELPAVAKLHFKTTAALQ